jgi:hypothetical protein
MSRSARRLSLAAAALLAVGVAARGQTPGTLPPAPVLPPAATPPPIPPSPTLGPPVPVTAPGAFPQNPASVPAPSGVGGQPLPPPPPSPFAPADPGRHGWGPYGPGSNCDPYFATVDLDLVGPAVKNRLRANVARTDGSITTVTVPSADLDWTVMPRFEIGFRLPDNAGAFAFGYRFLVSEGTDHDNLTGGRIKSRLNVNVFDFDYITSPYEPFPRWELKWWVGARLATNFYDSRDLAADGEGPRASNYFVGAGPHAGLEVDRHLPLIPGLALMGRIDGSVLIGQVRQRYVVNALGPADELVADEFTQRKTQTAEVLRLEAGARYTPPGLEFMTFSTGYLFERWWDVGRAGDARLELTTQGVFFRGEFNF